MRAKSSRGDVPRDESGTDDLDIKTTLSDARKKKKHARRRNCSKEISGMMRPSNESDKTTALPLITDETQPRCCICFSTEQDSMIRLESCTHGAHFECLKVPP